MVGVVNSSKAYRLAKFCFDRPEFKDRLASTSPKGWGMLKEKFIKDQGKRTYLDKANIELNTVQLVTDANGIKSMRDIENNPIKVDKMKFVIIEDPSYIQGHGERMVMLNAKTHHSIISGGQDIKYGGLITSNERGRLNRFQDVVIDTGHYEQPCKARAQNPEELARAQRFEQYLYKKFEEFVDEKKDLDETSTVGLGLEPLSERLKEFDEVQPLQCKVQKPVWMQMKPSISVA